MKGTSPNYQGETMNENETDYVDLGHCADADDLISRLSAYIAQNKSE